VSDIFQGHILGHIGTLGRIYTDCPACSDDRKTPTNRRKKVLGINYEDDQAVYFCNHCGKTGHVWLEPGRSTEIARIPGQSTEALAEFGGLGQAELDYFFRRGIEATDLDLFAAEKSFPVADDWVNLPAIGYPYRLDRNVKWIADNPRAGEKKLVRWERTGGGAGLYRRESIDWADQCLVICEGELDCESARWIGFNAISVPNGAPKGTQVSRIFKSIVDRINCFQRVVLAMDDDDAGAASLDALVDLVGRKRAHTVKYPAGCSDVNDILVRFGQDGLRAALTNTAPCLNGIVRPSFFVPAVNKLRTDGFTSGSKAGLAPLDELVQWHPGMLAIVSGVPSSGKSELIDQIMVSLADDGWKWAVFSPENTGEYHLAKLAAKRARAPIVGDVVLAADSEYESACAWVDDRFLFLSSDGGTSIQSVLDRAEACKHQLHADRFGLIIDPWNYISDTSVGSETEKINHLLSQVKRWATRTEINALVFIIAHPTKMRDDGGGVNVGGYDVAGSAHWFNRADYGMSVQADKESQLTNVTVWKVRFSWHGKPGVATLAYDLDTGCYSSPCGDASDLETIDWDVLEGLEAVRDAKLEIVSGPEAAPSQVPSGTGEKQIALV